MSITENRLVQDMHLLVVKVGLKYYLVKLRIIATYMVAPAPQIMSQVKDGLQHPMRDGITYSLLLALSI